MKTRHAYEQILAELHSELEVARVAFEEEAAAIRAGTISWHGPRPKAEAYRQSLVRFNAWLLDGIIPVEYLK